VTRLFHHKTGQPVDVPLTDNGTPLLPELCDRFEFLWRLYRWTGAQHYRDAVITTLIHLLDATLQVGPLTVTREPDRHQNVHLPWKVSNFAKHMAEIREVVSTTP
jgi:hypothetical protein